VQDDLGKHAERGRQGTDPDGSGTLLTLRDSMEKFSEIIHRRRQNYLIVCTGRNLEHSDNMYFHRGLKNHPTVIILYNLVISIE